MIFSIIALVLAFLVLVALMIIHEFGHFIIAKKFGVKVEEFGIGYPPRIFGKKIGETLYSVNLIPFGAFVRIQGEETSIDDYRSFSNLKIWKRVLIVIGGVAAFWLAAMVIFSIVFAIGADLPIGDQDVGGLYKTHVEVYFIEEDSPAKSAGLHSKDIINSIIVDNNIIHVDTIKDFQDITSEHKGEEIGLAIERNSAPMIISLTPRLEAPEGQGLVGIRLDRIATIIEDHLWYDAPIRGVLYTFESTWTALKGLYNVFSSLFQTQELPEGAEFAGPLGITIFIANASHYGPGFFLYFIGIISVFVAIFNLFPIPALDGGKLIFLLIEKLRGKAVPAEIEQKISVFFFIILISLSLFITVKYDIPRFSDFIQYSNQQ